MPENVDVIRVYLSVQGQVRTAGNTGMVVDLDHNAVWKYIEMNAIENPLSVFHGVTWLFHEMLEDARLKEDK